MNVIWDIRADFMELVFEWRFTGSEGVDHVHLSGKDVLGRGTGLNGGPGWELECFWDSKGLCV